VKVYTDIRQISKNIIYLREKICIVELFIKRMLVMGDFGPTSATTNTGFEPFNADIFKEAKLQQELNDSKDSDEGFSSSFSPTSESSMIQGEAISTSLHLWGNNTEKEDQYFINSLAPVSSNSNGSFLPSSSRRVVQAPSPTQNIKRPSPALCTFLGANKVAAHSLGVSNSNWNHQQPPTQTSSWPMNPPNPIGSNSMASNWNMPAMKNGLPNPPMQQHMNNAQQIKRICLQKPMVFYLTAAMATTQEIIRFHQILFIQRI